MYSVYINCTCSLKDSLISIAATDGGKITSDEKEGVLNYLIYAVGETPLVAILYSIEASILSFLMLFTLDTSFRKNLLQLLRCKRKKIVPEIMNITAIR